MCSRKVKSLQGFTLLEMLIAIAIFAMLGLAANAVLHTVMKNDIATEEFANKLKSLQQGFGALERDFGQMVARTPRLLEGGRGSTVLQTGSDLFDSESEAIVFYRIGWLNPDGVLPRGSLQSVAYVVQNHNLERWHFPYPEPEFGAEPIKTIVIKDVLSVEYSFFVNDSWQRKIDATELPKAIAMEIEVEDLGRVQRKFLLPLGAQLVPSDDEEQQGDDTESEDDTDTNGDGTETEEEETGENNG
ncbi:type II secretion system minor pseudopilin GspJ [Shewanella sp. Isolate11]|uniref:type II secretion system minor pseudopilin GspJ n=1 Tax=Shewanella sp. Isolate11 TaxID=2908530 RepID=UPI001EFD76BD|nr:type II secretion system minor pseudopilin GspJ [Shewanella sp. Isolate11]MCG9697905.1 type II secretion system minor pseudopilin GspJ [Shewanella sp. Isolate11]